MTVPLETRPAHLLEEPHDPRYVGRRAADGEFVAADMEIHGRELVLDETQGFVMTAEGLDHLVGVVEQDHLRPQPWEGSVEIHLRSALRR